MSHPSLTRSASACALALVAALALARPLTHAAVVTAPTFEALVATAGDIFLGEVVAATSRIEMRGAKRLIVTDVTFRTEEVLKGAPAPLKTITLLGGQVGEQRMDVPGMPRFMVGDRDVLFVQRRPSSLLPIVGLFHGRFRVVRGPGNVGAFVANSSRQPLSTAGEYARPNRAVAAARPLALAEFLRTVRTLTGAR